VKEPDEKKGKEGRGRKNSANGPDRKERGYGS
jgi:hypothetical protein